MTTLAETILSAMADSLNVDRERRANTTVKIEFSFEELGTIQATILHSLMNLSDRPSDLPNTLNKFIDQEIAAHKSVLEKIKSCRKLHRMETSNAAS